MNSNYKNILKILVPIIAIGSLGSFSVYKYVFNPDGLRNSKGNFYENNVTWDIDIDSFVKKCLTFEQDGSQIYFGEKRNRSRLKESDYDFTEQKITLKGFGKLFNACKINVSIEVLSFENQLNSEKAWFGTLESGYYPNIDRKDLEESDPRNTLLFPEGNILKANSSLKIELQSTDWFDATPTEGLEYIFRTIPDKDALISFKLDKEYTFGHSLFDEKSDPLVAGLEGIASFTIKLKNPHGKRTVHFTPTRCYVWTQKRSLTDGCELEKWQIKDKKTNKVIKNSIDLAKDRINWK